VLIDPAGPGPLLLPFCFWLPADAGRAARPPSAAPGSNQADPAAATARAASPAASPPVAEPAPLPPQPRQLRAAISAHLAAQGWPAAEPLRWAITAVDAARGWQLEGMAVQDAAPWAPGAG
jgi:hypothetical protein